MTFPFLGLITEISNNHNGSLDRAFRLLDAAKESGADAAKLQCYTPDELVTLRGDGLAPEPWGSQGWTMRNLYEKAMTPREWFPGLFRHAEKIELPLFSSVFGIDSLNLLEDCGCPCYKISSFERDKTALIQAVKKTGKPMLISRPDFPDAEIPTLFCPPGYPQKSIDLKKMARFFGFSYHGTKTLPIIVAARLTELVEFHFHLKEEPSELESNISIDQYQLGAMAETLKSSATEAVNG